MCPIKDLIKKKKYKSYSDKDSNLQDKDYQLIKLKNERDWLYNNKED